MSPEARYAELPDTGYHRSWSLAVGAVALGLGMGMVATGVRWPGAAIAVAGIALLGGTWVFRKKQSTTAVAPGQRREAAAIDPETGLPCPPQLTELLRREIARSQRYGDRTALAVFDVHVTGFTPDALHPKPPSPARHIAASLVECAREADIIARIDETHFVVMLTESDDNGAAQFAERTRTKLGTMPFARAVDGKGIYVRAWAGWERWNPSFQSPKEYLDAAMKQLQATRPSYEREQSWFKGDD
jgi:diguanylate cyclase (GGDEF)-like protein